MKINGWVKSLYYTLLWIFAGIFILQVFQSFVYNKIISETVSILDFSSLNALISYCFIITILLIKLIYILSYKKEWQINYLRISFVVCVIYSLYRYDIIHHPKWQFLTLNGFDYFSILYIVSVILLAHGLWIAKKNEAEFIIGSDEPINSKQFDEYGYYKYVKDLLNGVLSNKEFYKNRAFNIGIIGNWGSGKTSFLNLINYAINEDRKSGYYKKAIIIKFNPWFCKDKDQMQADFLNVLQSALSPYNPEIKNSTYKYAKMLSTVDISWLSKISKCYIEKKTTSLEQSFCKLNQCIGDIHLPVMIFIDDMDRLNGEEIMAVLNLVRNTANFVNTIFVLPYDEEYFLNTIKTQTGGKPKEYLEKIINLPYIIPVIRNSDKKEINYRMLVKLLNINGNRLSSVKLFFDNINDDFSLRSIKIFAQNILLANTKVKDSLNLFDLLLIEYLRLISNKLYLAVANNANNMLTVGRTDKNRFVLNKKKNRSINLVGTSEILTDDEYRQKYISPFFDSKSEILEKRCLHILELIFSVVEASNNPYRLKERSVFNSYFEKVLPGDYLAIEDVQSVLNTGNMNFYSNKLLEWSKTKNKNILAKLINDMEFDSLEIGIELMKATLILAPQNVSELLDDSFFPKPGCNHLHRTLHRDVYRNFLEDNNYDYYFDKKFMLLYDIGDILKDSNKYVEDNIGEFNLSDLWFNYLSVYLDNKNGFEEIDLALLLGCINIYEVNRSQAKSRIKEYLRNHISNFINNIDLENKDKILANFIAFTFSDTDPQGLNDNYKKWKQNFRVFLNAIPNDIKNTEEYENMSDWFTNLN